MAEPLLASADDAPTEELEEAFDGTAKVVSPAMESLEVWPSAPCVIVRVPNSVVPPSQTLLSPAPTLISSA